MSTTNKPATRPPDFDVSIMLKDNPACKGKVGAAWQESDGTISVLISLLVQLPRQEGQLVMKLFKRGRQSENKPASKFTGPPQEEDELDYMDTLKRGADL